MSSMANMPAMPTELHVPRTRPPAPLTKPEIAAIVTAVLEVGHLAQTGDEEAQALLRGLWERAEELPKRLEDRRLSLALLRRFLAKILKRAGEEREETITRTLAFHLRFAHYFIPEAEIIKARDAELKRLTRSRDEQRRADVEGWELFVSEAGKGGPMEAAGILMKCLDLEDGPRILDDFQAEARQEFGRAAQREIGLQQAKADFEALFGAADVDGTPSSVPGRRPTASLPSPLVGRADDWQPIMFRDPVAFEFLGPTVRAIAKVDLGIVLDESEANARPMAIMPSMPERD